MMRADATALAWYIERDGGRYANFAADGARDVVVPCLGGTITYHVPASMVAAVEAARDVVYHTIRERQRRTVR